MSIDKANVFWHLILAYANSHFALGEQGNSGEFHSEKAEAEIKAGLAEDEKALILKFADVTGWRPVKIEGTEANNWQETWKFDDAS